MKIEIGTAGREGFVNNILVRFSNGLVLATPGSLVFCGRDGKEKILGKLREVIAELESMNIEVAGQENI